MTTRPYTPAELAQLEREQHADMRAARAKTLDMLTELAVLIDYLTPRGLDGGRSHLRAHEIITTLGHGLGDD